MKRNRKRKCGDRRLLREIRAHRVQLICLLGSILLAGLVQAGSGAVISDGRLSRDGYGGSRKTYQLQVEGLLPDAGETEISLSVAPRQYGKEEAAEAMEALAERLPLVILGENESLSEVRSDLFLPRNDEESGLRISWYPEDTELLAYSGSVENRQLSGPEKTALKAVITDGTYSRSYVYELTVFPRLLSEEEALLSGFYALLEKTESEQAESAQLWLPSSFCGRQLTYREARGHEAVYILLLGSFSAILLGLRERSEEQAKKQKRSEELLLDYSELVSKFMVYLGAGLSVRNTWLKIAEQYVQAGESGMRTETRAVYEEMLYSVSELKKGVPEGQVYQAFGRRCRLQPYIRFCALLEQNRKNGGKYLRTLLSAEMENAFEERKNAAKRKGEEAGTKLLLPLFLMLLIVMLIVIVPAMLSMA